jgi:hypothetical protein
MAHKYDVHIFAITRIKVCGIEADSQQQAIENTDQIDLHAYLDRNLCPSEGESALRGEVAYIEYAEDIDSYLVDEQGDGDFSLSRRYDKHGNPDADASTGAWQITLCGHAGISLMQAEEDEICGMWLWSAENESSDTCFTSEENAAVNAVDRLFPVAEWREAVANDGIMQSYRQWAEDRADAYREESEAA